MLNFSWHKFLSFYITIITIAGTLISCSVDAPKDRETTNENGSFYVSKISEKSIKFNVDKEFSFPEMSISNIEICINETASGKAIKLHNFEIQNGKKDNYETYKTDEGGCLVYKDKVKFNYLSNESYYIHFKRTVVSKGIQRGVQVINYSFSPWRRGDTGKDFYDLDKGGEKPPKFVPSEDAGEYLSGTHSEKAELWLGGVDNVQIDSGKLKWDGHISKLELHIKPKIKFLDVYGETLFATIKKGNFTVKPYLISNKHLMTDETNRNVISILDKNEENKTEKMVYQTIKLTRNISIPLIPNDGDIDLGLIIKAASTSNMINENLKPFHGIYYYKEFNKMVGKAGVPLSAERTNNIDFNLAKYVDLDANFVKKDFAAFKAHIKAVKNIEDKGLKKYDNKLRMSYKASQGWSINRLQIKVIKPKFLKYGAFSLPNLNVQFNTSACVTDPFSRTPIANYKFNVHTSYKDDTGKRIILERTTSDVEKDKGCITWPDELTFKAYDKEHYIPRYFFLENKNMTFKERFGVVLNPWDFGFTFGSVLSKREDLLEKNKGIDKRPPSTVYIPDFTYRNLGFDYRIDKNLNLILRKHMIVRIHPDYMAYHALTRFRPIFPLYPGKYLLKLVLMRNFYEDPVHAGEYISHVTKFVEIFRGRIMADVTFEIDDIRLMGSRNVLMIEIFPVYEKDVTTDKTGQIVPKDKDLRIYDTHTNTERLEIEKKWENLIAKDSGLVSKPYVGPILILNETGGSPLLPGDRTSRNNVMSPYNIERLLSKFPKPYEYNNAIDFINKKIQIPGMLPDDHVTLQSIQARGGGDNYISKEQAHQMALDAKSEKGGGLINEVKRNNSFSEESYMRKSKDGDTLKGFGKNDPREGGLIVDPAEHKNTNLDISATIPYQRQKRLELELDDPRIKDKHARFIKEEYFKGLTKLKYIFRYGGYKANGDYTVKKLDLEIFRSYIDVDTNFVEEKPNWIYELIPIEYIDERTKKIRTGYAPPPYDITTTQMISRGEQITKLKEIEAEKSSDINIFLKENKLEHIELTNIEQTADFLQKLSRPLWKTNPYDKIYVHSRKLEAKYTPDFIKNSLNEYDIQTINEVDEDYSISKDDLENLIENGTMSPKFVRHLCRYWFYDLARNMYKSKHGPAHLAHFNIVRNCLNKSEKNYWSTFIIEKKIRVHHLKDFKHKRGLSVNMSVNSGINWGYGQSESLANNTTFDGKLALFKLGASKSLSLSRSENFNKGINQGSSTSINLVVQKNEFKLTFDSYEKCVSIKLNPFTYYIPGEDEEFDNDIFIKSKHFINQTVYWNEELKNKEKRDFLRKGYFICTGKPINEDKTVDENYYYITQHFNVGHSFDMPSIKNRWFDIALRGDQTLTLFMSLLHGEQYSKLEDDKKDRNLLSYNLLNYHLRLNVTPVNRTNETLFALLPIYKKLPTSFYKIYSEPVNENTFKEFEW